LKALKTLVAAISSFLLVILLQVPCAAQKHPHAMTYGPAMAGTWQALWPRDNFALKGVSIRVGGAESSAQVIFDTELLRVSAIALDHRQELRGTAYDGAHGPGLKIVGNQVLATPVGPGWAFAGSFNDPRLIPHGPLPKTWGRYKGLYLHGQKVVLRYDVGGCDVLEHFEVSGKGDGRLLTRILDLGKSTKQMTMMVGLRQGARPKVIGTNLVVLEYEVKATGIASTEKAGRAWTDLAMGAPSNNDYADARSGNGVETRFVEGFGKPDKKSGAEGSNLPRLHDGFAARNADDRDRTTWFRGRGPARMVTDLKKTIHIGQINTFSRHRNQRAPQRYILYGSAAAKAPDGKAKNPRRVGWKMITSVDSRSLGNGGMHGVRLAKGEGTIGQYRHLLWISRHKETFFTEFDIYDAENKPRNSSPGRRGSYVTGVALSGAPAGAKLEVTDGSVRLKLPARGSREQLKLVFFDCSGDSFANVKKKVAALAPATSLAAMTKGGPRRWSDGVRTKGALGRGKGAYVVDRLGIPSDGETASHLRFGGFDFFSDGRAALSTWNGDVWVLSGIDAKLENLKWKRFATGLFDPLGLRIVDDVIYTLGRDGINRLHDLNGDGEADFYECFNNEVLMTKSFHEFAFDLQTDNEGNFYFSKGGPVRPGGRGFDKLVPHHGCILKVSKDGSKLEVFATGLRAPNGMGVGPNGEVTSGDNEGTWVPACRLNWMKKGTFNGCVDTAHLPTKPTMYDYPICFMPMRIDNSGGGQVWVTTDKWGPFEGDLLHLSYGKSTLFKTMREEVDGVTQGGVTPFPLKFTSSAMRARVHPKTGQLFVCGFRGWQTNAVKMTGFDRVRYTDKPVRMLTALKTARDGVYLTFTCPLDKETAEDPESYEVEAWNYLWTRKYGSPEVSTVGADPKANKGAKPKHDAWQVERATLQADGKTVFLKLPDIKPVMQMRVKFDIDAADGEKVKSELHSSIHRLPK
jgi:hypothetical protein